MNLNKFLLGAVTLACIAPAVHAAEATDGAWDQTWMVRGRVIGLAPSNDGGDVSIGGKINASTNVVPEVDVTYFLNRNIGFELIAATTQHSLHADKRPAELDLGDVRLLPPTLTAQYHVPCGDWKPYVGAGLTYAHFYDETHPGWSSVKVDDAVGFAAQAGVDYAISGPWVANVDVKKIWVSTDATVNGTVTAKANLNPWVVGAGVGYRF